MSLSYPLGGMPAAVWGRVDGEGCSNCSRGIPHSLVLLLPSLQRGGYTCLPSQGRVLAPSFPLRIQPCLQVDAAMLKPLR